MPSFEEIQKARILNSFNTDEGLSELTKAEILDIEKGGKRAMIGERRTFAGREYIKTADGWKFHGKGTGSKAQSHVAGALEHHVGEKKEEESKLDLSGHSDEDLDDAQMARLRGGMSENHPEMKQIQAEKDKRKSSKLTHKDATDHFVEEDGKHYIDTLDPDTGEKKFKPGDKVKYIDDNGKRHKGTLSDREHPDGDMFEVDREGDEKGKTEFDKLQQSYNEKVNSLNLLKNDGWKGSFSTNSTTKSYGEEKFVKEMIVRVEMTLKTKDTYFSVDCGYAKSPEFGEEADNYYSKLTSLKEKKFTTAREAAKAADKFADDWNKEE